MLVRQQTNYKGDKFYIVLFNDDGTEHSRTEIPRHLTDDEMRYFCTECERIAREMLESWIIYGQRTNSV